MVIEETSVEKNDFYYGELFSLAGGTKNHNNIILNVGISLKGNKKQGLETSEIWTCQTFGNLNGILEFNRLGFILPLATVYDSIEFQNN